MQLSPRRLELLVKRTFLLEDLIAFFELKSVSESVAGRLFVLLTGAVILGVFWGVFYLTGSYLLSALAACVPTIAYIWRLSVTIGRRDRGNLKSGKGSGN